MTSILIRNLKLEIPLEQPRRYLWRRSRGATHLKSDRVKILQDISADISQGERVGLIGHNGAGKSTLLRAMAGVYPPTSGNIICAGNIRSLFSLHAGIDSDATARQNIYLIGLAQGIPYATLRKKEDEIIAFSGLEEFIDRPIRTFSAGMATRLSFSVTTCDDAEILLVDEIIGAGDLEFQQKAQARINSMMEASAIFVAASHNNVFLSQLCTRGIVMKNGSIVFDGEIDTAIGFYLEPEITEIALS